MAAEAKSPKANKPPKDVMGWLEYYLVTKAPFQIPDSGREAIVKYGPWIDVILLVLFAPALLLLLGIGAALSPFSMMGGTGVAAGLSLALAILVIQIILMVAALPGLFNRRISGWNLAFAGVVLNVVYGLTTFHILNSVISAVVSSYVLFQIRSYYKK